MVLRYEQNYSLSACQDIAKIGRGIPHFVNPRMHPYGMVNSYMASHHKRWSKHTVRTVAESLLDYLRWMEGAVLTLEKTKLRHVELYMNAIAEANSDRPLNVSTVVQRVGHVCRLFNWVRRCGNFPVIWDGDEDAERGLIRSTRRGFPNRAASSITPRLVHQNTRFLLLQDAIKFIEAFKTHGDIEHRALAVRNQLMAKVMLQCGLRVEEVVTLPAFWVRDIVIGGRPMQLGRVRGKGNKIRPIEWPTQLLLEVQEYIDFQRQFVIECAQASDASYTESAALFLSGDGQELTTNWVGKLFKQASKESGIHCTPHMLRHTYGTYHYLLHRDLAKLANLMGHSSEETTRTYYVHTAALVSMTDKFNDFQSQIDAALEIVQE